MKIAIASGKGGTGKTTLSVSFALHLAQHYETVVLADCDVEEPNSHIFFPTISYTESVVTALHPHVDSNACSGCGTCSAACQFNALAALADDVLVFHELCHACGLCEQVCPTAAITEKPYELGKIQEFNHQQLRLVHGLLNIGEASPVPVIKEVKHRIETADPVIIDAPPGTSCPVIHAVWGTDFVILVTEPTPFGLNDLALAVGMVRKIGIPFGVVINQSGIGDDRVNRYCNEESIPVIAEIPYHKSIAQAYSRGEPLLTAYPESKTIFDTMYTHIVEVVRD